MSAPGQRVGNADFVPVILGTALNAYNIARCLHEAYGIRSLAIGRAAVAETARSRIVDVRATADFGTAEGILSTLRGVAEEFAGRKLLLLPTIEYYTNVVLDNADELSRLFVIPLVPRRTADLLIDKTAFYATCERLGVAHPRTVVVRPAEVRNPTLGDDLPFPYPAILKPSNTDIYPRLSFAGKRKVYVVGDAAELRNTAARIVAAGYDDDLIVQDYLAGDERVMRVSNTYSGKDGKLLLASTAAVVLATREPATLGNYSAALSVPDDEVAASLRTLLDGVGYVGPGNADVMIDARDGSARVLEVNLRLGAASFYARAAGVNLPRAIVEDWVYGRPPAPSVARRRRLWVNLPAPLAIALAPGALRWRALAASFKGVTHTLWYIRDAGPRRVLTVVRLDARAAVKALRYARSPLGA